MPWSNGVEHSFVEQDRQSIVADAHVLWHFATVRSVSGITD